MDQNQDNKNTASLRLAAGQKKRDVPIANSIIAQSRGNDNRSIPIYDGERVIGYLRNNGTLLHRKMQGSRHILRNPRAISFGVKPLKDAIRLGCRYVMVEDTEDGKRYTAPIMAFFEQGFRVERGWGEQCALELVHWEITDTKNPAIQLSIFEGVSHGG